MKTTKFFTRSKALLNPGEALPITKNLFQCWTRHSPRAGTIFKYASPETIAGRSLLEKKNFKLLGVGVRCDDAKIRSTTCLRFVYVSRFGGLDLDHLPSRRRPNASAGFA